MLRIKKGKGLIAYETDRPLIHFEGLGSDSFPELGTTIDGIVVSEIPDGSTFEAKDTGILFTRVSGTWIRRELYPELAAIVNLLVEQNLELRRVVRGMEILNDQSLDDVK